MSMGVFRTGRDVSTLFAFKSGRSFAKFRGGKNLWDYRIRKERRM